MSNTVIHMPSGGIPTLPRARLIFVPRRNGKPRSDVDALARDVQAKMFIAAAPIGALDVQLVFFRGDHLSKRRNGYRAVSK